MKRFSRRLLSMLLSAAMVFGLSGITALAEETDAEEPETVADTEAYDVKYAVTIWGIDQDKDEKGRTLGLTFGPATGADYTNSYVAHLDENEYDPDNGQFCIHWMTWEEIARQSRIDPSVFQGCLEAGCTHSVNIVLNDELLETSYTGQMDDGDGAGALRYSVKDNYLKWNAERSNTWGYPGSQVRAVLVGKDELSMSVNIYMPDEENCLFSCFPEELQNEIIAKEVDSYSNNIMTASDSQIVYDKLWLFSGKETYAESGGYEDAVIHPLEGELYQRSILRGITTDFDGHADLCNWGEEGKPVSWWLRSMAQGNSTQVYQVNANGVPNYFDTSDVYSIALGFCLQGQADLTELYAAVEAAEALGEEAYTEASWTVLKEALDAAYKICDTEAVRQSEVDEATLALQDAIDNLVIKADKTALGAVIEEANALNREYYTDASWAVLMEALTNAQAVYDDVNVSQEETDAAQAELEDAIANLVSVADKTALENAIATAQELEQDKASFTTDSWSAVETALAAAQEVDADRDVTQEEVDEATDALISAIAYLVKNDGQSVDKSELLQLYDQARALSESDYTTDSWNELQTAVADAQAVLLNVNATQEDVERALNELQSALDVLVSAADKTALIAVVEEAYALNEGDYTPSSWNVLEEALAEAETVLSDGNALQKDVEEALEVLQSALAGLVERADKSDLEAAIEAAVALEESKDDYTADSWEALVTALAAAQAIDGDAEALQDEVDDVTINLVTAAAMLELLNPTSEEVDKSELLNLYEEAIHLTESDYSEETWSVLAEALLNAQAVLMDSYTTQDVIDEARDELQTAMDGLKAPDAAAFAIYSADDDSLTFYAEADGSFPKEGGTYHDKEATAVYREVDSLSANGTGDIPWYELGEDVKTVAIDPSFEQVQPISLAYWFYGYQVPAISGLEYIDISETRSLQYTFRGCSTLETLEVSDWDTSNVTTMYGTFRECQCLQSLDLSEWDVSNTSTMGDMFNHCEGITSVGDISGWDTSANLAMGSMFNSCFQLAELDLSNWDTSHVTSMENLFYACDALTEVGDLSGWNTSSNRTMANMFYRCSSLTEVDLSGWDTGNVSSMANLFRECSSLTSVGDLKGWDTSNVTTMEQMFYQCSSLESVNLSNWNTSKVTNMSYMFRNCESFTNLDLSGWDTTSVEANESFATGCTALEWVAIGENTNIFRLGQCITQRNWYDSPEGGNLVSSNYLQDVEEAGMYWTSTTGMPEAFAVYSEEDDSLSFYYDIAPAEGESYHDKAATAVFRNVDSVVATGTSGIPWYDIREDVTSVEIDASFAEAQPQSLAYWFNECGNASFSGLEYIDISEVTSLRRTFSFCSALTSLDLSGWDTAKVTTMYGMFYDCPALASVGDLSGWDTSAATTIYGMFYNDSSLTSVGDLSNWDTSNVTDMSYTFRDCSSFTSLDLSGWDTTSVTDNTSFATGCSALEWVAIGENTNIFRLGQCVTQRNWYDSPESGSLVSSSYLTDVYEAGTYWTSTTNAREAFAVYSATDDSLTFYRDIVPAEGETYKGKTVTTVYKDVDILAATGTSGIPWYGIRDDVTSVVIDESFAEVQPVSLAYWFDGFGNASFSGLENIDTSEVTNLRSTFLYCSSLTELNLSDWDTSKVTNMSSVFYDCPALASVGDLSGWDTSSVTTIYGMFYNDSSLTSVGDLSNWDTANVTTMQYTFRDCSKLTDLGDLSGLNTANVTTLQQTFYNCNSLTGMDVSGWDTANVTDMSYTFGNCSSFTSLDLSGWDTSSVTTNTNFATGCSALEWVAIGENTNIFRLGQCITQRNWYDGPESGAIVSRNYLQDVTQAGKYWATTTNAPEAFAVYSATDNSLTFYEDALPTEGDTYKGKAATTVYTEVESLAASSAESIPWYDKRDSVTSVVIDSSFAAARPISLAYWFNGFANASFGGLEYMDTSEVTTMRSTFANCSAAASLELSGWDTSKVTTLREMFNTCSTLTSLDLSSWDTAKVTSMSSLFYNCPSLTSLGDLSGWDTSANTNMSGIFYNCSSLTSLELSDWDTAKVTTMTYLFQSCSNLTDVGDLSDWDTANVTNMTGTFRNCTSICSIDISGWNTTSVTTNTNFATGCSALEWVAIGEDTTIFTLGQCITQQNWYDRSYNGTLVSSSYLQDVTEPGQYWTYTELYTADKSELQAEYDADSQLNEVDYTASSWEPFAEALAAAKEVLDDSNASGEAIGTALIDLENARNGLVEVCDKTALEEEYNADILLREEDYTPATWAPFAEALAAAKDVIDNANATQTQVNEALSALQTAKEGLVKAAGKAELDAVIAEAKTLKQDSYTDDSWAVFEKALAAAEAVADDANATQSEVDEALEVLESAMNSLVEVTDKSNLKDVLETVEAEALDGADYTAESWALFEDALKEAQDVVNNPDATQDDIDDATVALVSAVAGLKHADSTVADADKTSLLDEYVEDLTLSGSGYTADSWAAYEEALSTAQGVLLDPNASQDAVNTALDALQTARNNLKEAPKVSGVTVTAPNSTKTYDGNGITLTATAEVSPDTAEISCQWYKDGTAISGAIGSSYTTGGNVSDSGTYKCVVTATSGSESASAEGTISITINAAPQSISYATTSVSKTVGDAAFTNTLTQTTVSTESGAGISYKSSNTSVATVDGNGKVTILSDGTTTITATAAATANYKEATASYTLKVASNKNGLYKIKSGEWGYYKNGEVDKDYTGFASNSNGDWYVVNGYIHFDQNTVAKDATGALGSKGNWYYVIGSEVQHNFTGLANYKNSNGWWYIKSGKVDFTHNGVDKNKNGWWYVTGGKVQLDYTGVANYKNSSGWWYIQGGKVDFSANTVAKNKNGWWYVTGGKVQFGYTGVANYKNSNGWWYIQAGKVNFNFNGIASNKNGTWYVRGGKVQLSYNGTVTYRNRTYTIRNGRAG